jgi:ribosomal protein S1
MICPYCATPLPEEAWTCHECGGMLEADSSSDQLPLIESKWQMIRRQCSFQFKARVYHSNNGGLLVNLYTVRGFVPLAHLAKSIEDLPYEQEIFLKVIGSDRGFHELILSEKAIYNKIHINKNKYKSKYKNRIFDDSTFRVGDVFHGIVVNVTGFGVFVDHDGYVGLLHISQFGENKNKPPTEVFSIGQEVEVFIQSIDIEKQRIALRWGE